LAISRRKQIFVAFPHTVSDDNLLIDMGKKSKSSPVVTVIGGDPRARFAKKS